MSPRVRRGALWALLVVQLFGLLASIVLTWHHEVALYGGVTDAGEMIGCSATEKVDCDLVNTSDWSELLGVPIATWGAATYVVLGLLTGRALAGLRDGLPIVFAAGLAATAYSALLYWVSINELHYVCAWCMRLYVVNLATPFLAGLGGALREPVPRPTAWGATALVFATVSLVAVGGQRLYRASLLGEAAGIGLVAVEGATVEPTADGADPEGETPVRRFEVTTEDGNAAVLELLPDDPWKGSRDASVTIVEFMDLECGYCKRTAGEFERLLEVYGDRVLFVAKHYPMDPACNPGVNNRKHRHACDAARAAVCAREQGRFWTFHDLAFKNQHELGPDDLLLYAEVAGLDLDAYRACVASDRSLERVRRDTAQGAALDLHGTPRIFIDGQLYRGGRSAQQLAVQVERALGSDPEAMRATVARMREERPRIEPIPADVPAERDVDGEGSFRIDTFEAALRDGVAFSGKHEIPATHMSWFAARDACEAAGKRLCTEQEWVTACQGRPAVDDDGDGELADDLIEGTTYPYGDLHEPGRCWDGRTKDADRPVYTGEMPGCRTTDGVYDMTGNVEEWAGATPETAVLLGGAYDTSRDHARCYRRNDTFGPGYANVRTGFRCCSGEAP